MKKLSIVVILLALAFNLQAQKKKNPYLKQTTSEAGISLATSGELSMVTLSANQYWGVGRKKRNFKLGLGARLTSSFGGDGIVYMTAPAKLTSGKTGPSVFFSEQVPQNIDTLKLDATQVNAINLFLALRYDFKKKWGVEFNIDLAGFSFGGSQSSILTYGENSNATRSVNSKPSSKNLLLISDNDIGSLNSELVISYLYKNKIKFKVLASFLFNEYTVDNPVLYTNSIGTVVDAETYRTKALAFGIGANYIFKYKK